MSLTAPVYQSYCDICHNHKCLTSVGISNSKYQLHYCNNQGCSTSLMDKLGKYYEICGKKSPEFILTDYKNYEVDPRKEMENPDVIEYINSCRDTFLNFLPNIPNFNQNEKTKDITVVMAIAIWES